MFHDHHGGAAGQAAGRHRFPEKPRSITTLLWRLGLSSSREKKEKEGRRARPSLTVEAPPFVAGPVIALAGVLKILKRV